MMDDIAQVQGIRRNLGLTQKELAELAGVSQSLVAKIENNSIDPAYSKVRKIFEALSRFSKRKELKASEIMTCRLIFVSPKDSIKKAIKKMKQFNISQLPVLDEKKQVGRITETDILDALTKDIATDTSVSLIMNDEAPTVSKDTSVMLVSSLLKQYNFILVSNKGRIIGVITKADLLTKAYG